jgi:hypothetical protein
VVREDPESPGVCIIPGGDASRGLAGGGKVVMSSQMIWGITRGGDSNVKYHKIKVFLLPAKFLGGKKMEM